MSLVLTNEFDFDILVPVRRFATLHVYAYLLYSPYGLFCFFGSSLGSR